MGAKLLLWEKKAVTARFVNWTPASQNSVERAKYIHFTIMKLFAHRTEAHVKITM